MWSVVWSCGGRLAVWARAIATGLPGRDATPGSRRDERADVISYERRLTSVAKFAYVHRYLFWVCARKPNVTCAASGE